MFRACLFKGDDTINTLISKNYKRIFYGKNENQFGDLRLPEGPGPYPLAIVIHGGFWKSQFELSLMDDFSDALTNSGIATWNIEYRRVGQIGGGWPGTFLDSAKATDFARNLADSYPIDLSRVITIGHSAGGHLALWLAARNNLSSTSELVRSANPLPLKGVISLAGVSDLELMFDIHQWKKRLIGIANNPTMDFIGGSPREYQQRYEQGSPTLILPIGVPLVLIHGSLDVDVPIGISEHFETVSKLAGDEVSLETIPTGEHFKLIVPDSEAWPIIIKKTRDLLND